MNVSNAGYVLARSLLSATTPPTQLIDVIIETRNVTLLEHALANTHLPLDAAERCYQAIPGDPDTRHARQGAYANLVGHRLRAGLPASEVAADAWAQWAALDRPIRFTSLLMDRATKAGQGKALWQSLLTDTTWEQVTALARAATSDTLPALLARMDDLATAVNKLPKSQFENAGLAASNTLAHYSEEYCVSVLADVRSPALIVFLLAGVFSNPTPAVCDLVATRVVPAWLRGELPGDKWTRHVAALVKASCGQWSASAAAAAAAGLPGVPTGQHADGIRTKVTAVHDGHGDTAATEARIRLGRITTIVDVMSADRSPSVGDWLIAQLGENVDWVAALTAADALHTETRLDDAVTVMRDIASQ